MRYPSRFPVLVMLEHHMMPLTEEHFEIFRRVVEFVAVAVMHDLHRLEVALEELFGKDSVNPAGFTPRLFAVLAGALVRVFHGLRCGYGYTELYYYGIMELFKTRVWSTRDPKCSPAIPELACPLQPHSASGVLPNLLPR